MVGHMRPSQMIVCSISAMHMLEVLVHYRPPSYRPPSYSGGHWVKQSSKVVATWALSRDTRHSKSKLHRILRRGPKRGSAVKNGLTIELVRQIF